MQSNKSGAADDTWHRAQTQLWESWFNLLESATTPNIGSWQKMSTASAESWLENAPPTMRHTAEQMIAGNQALFGFLQLATEAWKEIGIRIAAGEAWQPVLERYMEQIRGQVSAGQATLAASQQQFQSWTQPWLGAWEKTAAQFGQFNGAPTSPEGGPFSLYGDSGSAVFDAFQQTFGRLLDAPSLGYARESDARLRRLAKTGQALQAANLEYGLVLGDAWANAFEKLQHALVERAQTNQPVRNLGEFSSLWAEIADPAFYEIFVNEKFIRAQGKLLSAMMEYRIQQRHLIEQISQSLDIPTRSEVDAAHKSIHTQRREIRTLKNALSEAADRVADLETSVAALQKSAKPAKKARKSASSRGSSKKSSTQKSKRKPAAAANEKRSTRKRRNGEVTS